MIKYMQLTGLLTGLAALARLACVVNGRLQRALLCVRLQQRSDEVSTYVSTGQRWERYRERASSFWWQRSKCIRTRLYALECLEQADSRDTLWLRPQSDKHIPALRKLGMRNSRHVLAR